MSKLDELDKEFDERAKYDESEGLMLGCCGGDYCKWSHKDEPVDWDRHNKEIKSFARKYYEAGQEDMFYEKFKKLIQWEYERGRLEEREALKKLVEGMKKPEEDERHEGYNQALADLKTKIKEL